MSNAEKKQKPYISNEKIHHSEIMSQKTNNLTNYHSHSSFCDGKAPIEDFIKKAIDQGFSSYGISSHAPLPFSTKWNMEQADVPEYLSQIDQLKEKYSNKIELYAGMEIDYLNRIHNPANNYFQTLPLDYRIGSVHMLYDNKGEIVDLDSKPDIFANNIKEHFHNNLKNTIISYYDKLIDMIELGGFDILGHADKISLNANIYHPGILKEKWYLDKIKEYFHFIAEKQIMVEINTKAYTLYNIFFPNQEHFQLIKNLQIPVLVNSDSHHPDLINSGRIEALTCLKNAGIKTVREYTNKRWQDIPIQ